MAMTTQEALTNLRKYEEEERNWRSARQKISELLEAALAAERIVSDAEGRKAKIEADIDRLLREAAKTEAAVTAVNEKLGAFQTEHAAKQQKLAELDAAIAAKEAELEKANAAFDAFKKTHLQMT